MCAMGFVLSKGREGTDRNGYKFGDLSKGLVGHFSGAPMIQGKPGATPTGE
jgi:hypothetical protein